jgi:hypothetical protein
VTKAKLGSESAFYYDEKLKQWVDGSVPESERAAAERDVGAPPVMPAAVGNVSGGVGDGVGGGSAPGFGAMHAPPVHASGTGSPRAGGIRSRYVDVFARDGMTTTTATTTNGTAAGAVPVANVNAFIPSAAPIGGFNGAGNGAVGTPAPGGMNFFVPAPRAPEDDDGETDSMREPLMLMQTAPNASDAAVEDSEALNVNATEAGGGSAADAAPVVQADVASVAGATTGGAFSTEDTPVAFGGSEENHGTTSWVDPEGESARWDAGGDAFVAQEEDAALQTGDSLAARQPQWQAEDPMGQPAPQWETQTEQWLQQAPSESADDAVQEEHLTESGVGTGEGDEGGQPESAQATTTTTQTDDGAWHGYEGHEDYDYDPRWKFDEATGEWYWDGGDDDEWIERAKHDAALAELQTRLDSRVVELDEALSSRDALVNELAQVRESKDAEICELSSRIADLETRAAEPSTAAVVDEAAVDDAYRRGKEDGYKEGYAAGSAEAQEELEDLLVCLGQEGRRVEKLRGMLAESGADIDAIIAEFEAEEEAEIAALVSGDKPHSVVETTDADADADADAIDDGDITLPEISQSLKEMAAEIETPERLRDYQSNLNADAEEFILPTPPKANHDRANNNLERAFELA